MAAMRATVSAEEMELVAMMNKRSEYAVPNAETRHESTSGSCQALHEECSEAETENFLAQKFEGYKHNVSSEENVQAPTEKSTERAAREGKFGECAMQPLLECTKDHVTRRSGLAPARARKRNEQPARAGGRCHVTMPSRQVRARKFRRRVGPSGTCGRGGAN